MIPRDTNATVSDVSSIMVLNSHGDWTPEFTIELADGRVGRGAAPQGETPSIYEDHPAEEGVRHETVVDIRKVLVGQVYDQASLDQLLVNCGHSWGLRAVYGLSVAFYEATRLSIGTNRSVGALEKADGRCPRLLFNLVNGGLHAYTNPVTSDFHEFLLMSRTDDLEGAVDAYRRLLDHTRVALADVPERIIGGNRVHDLGASPNEAALSLISELIERAGLKEIFGIMIDASSGDWFDGDQYALPITGRRLDPGELADHWLSLLNRFDLTMLEDPLAETDLDAWDLLHKACKGNCQLLGDNFTSTQPSELASKSGMVDGVLLKPDQNGTVSGTLEFASLARTSGLPLVASHRSIETDTPFLIHLATELNVEYIKIGPFSDFSSVMRTNELLRGASR